MVSFHQTEQGIQDAIAEAIAATVQSQPAEPDKLKEGHNCRPGKLAALVLPSHGPSQEARRLMYSKEILSTVFRGQELMHADGFAVGVHTGLERGLGWKGAAFNLLAYSMTVGIFNLPRCAAVLGFVPFVFLVFAFQYMTWFTGMAYARLRHRYPGIHSVPDAVHLIYGETGRTIVAAFQLLFSIMLSGNHIILGSYAFHTLGWQSCAVVLNVVFTVISFFCSLPRSYRLFANLAFLSAISVTTCMIVVCVAASTHGPNHLLPNTRPKQLLAFGPLSADDAGFFPVVLAITNLFFSFGAQPSYFPLMGEMRYPQHFPRALLLLIIFQTAVYLVMTGVVMHSLGEYVTSPIVASLSPETQRLCYMLALPAFIISGCSSGQVSAKQLYVVALRRMPWIKMRTSSTWLAWMLINVLTWTSAWILAELVPFFGSFMAVESSLVWVIYIALGSVFALFLNMDRLTHAWPDRIETAGALLLVVFCVFLSVAGLWSAVAAIIHSYIHGDVDYPFSCAVSAG